MYNALKDILLELLRAPGEPPAPPAGTHASLQIFRASPNYLRYQIAILTVLMVVVGLVLFGLGIALLVNEPFYGAAACILMGFLWSIVSAGAYFGIRLEYDMRYYILTDRSLRIRKGVWSIIEQTLTFVNIQNIAVEQGPLERLFGISRLVVETAGGGGTVAGHQPGAVMQNFHRATLSGLENAAEIREQIILYLKKIPHSGGLGIPGEDIHLKRQGLGRDEIEVLRQILTETKSLRNALVEE